MQDSKKAELRGKAKVPMEFRKRPVSEVRCRSQRRESSGERQKPRESHESDLLRRLDAGVKEGKALGKGKLPHRVTIETCFGGSMQEVKEGRALGKGKSPHGVTIRVLLGGSMQGESEKGGALGKGQCPDRVPNSDLVFFRRNLD